MHSDLYIAKGGRLFKKDFEACVLVLSHAAGHKFHLFSTAGRGARSHYSASIFAPAVGVLEFFKLPYKRENIAPRGGKLGEVFSINEKKRIRNSSVSLMPLRASGLAAPQPC